MTLSPDRPKPSEPSTTSADYLHSTQPGSGLRAPARSWLHSDAPSLSLNGDWKFRLLPGVPGLPGGDALNHGLLAENEGPEGVAAQNFDDSAWDSMPVPSHWVLQQDGKYGLPIYTNVQFPFPIEPPFVPDANPTGDYRRRFTIPEGWQNSKDKNDAGNTVLLRFDGVESRYKVWVNGQEIGVGSGSRLAQEFDITHALQEGENLIVVRVHQWSASSYVEDQDQWWLPGIFRDVTLQLRQAAGIQDIWLRTEWSATTDPQNGTGTLIPEITANSKAFPITLEVPELGVKVSWNSAADVVPLEIENTKPWTAETPHLYDAKVSNAAETITQRIGFRTVKIEGDQFLVNGRRVVFHGVNRHETNADRGRVFNEEDARKDLELMKRFNVNAIRTSHYPPHPRLLDLADELGFWVILECDLETHGFEARGWIDNPSDDPQWRDAYLDRIERTVERDKNHASIVMWSLGNESGTGANLAAMSAWIHARDNGRPVHYEGDYTGAYTDVYSRMYSSIPETDSIGRDDSDWLLLGCTAAESARQRSKPFILCEYVHAMGNGPGGIDQYERLVEKYPRLHGGFVWEWRDHGLRSHTADGTEFFAYGGDFGEVVHDSNFVMDGLILSDSTPTPGLHEYKAVAAPLRLSIDGSTVTLRNMRHTADSGDVTLRWRVEHDGVPFHSGDLTLGAVPAGSSAATELPAAVAHARDSQAAADARETWLTVEAVLTETTVWAESGHVITLTQQNLTRPKRPVSTPRPAPQQRQVASGTITLGPATFTAGKLVELAGLPVNGPRLELWRAPTDNDNGGGFGSYDAADPWLNMGRGVKAPPLSQTWRKAGLDRLTARVESATEWNEGIQRTTRYSVADGRDHGRVEENWQLANGELWLRIDITPSAGWDTIWPRIGVRLDLPTSVDGAAWFGTGPYESYPDSSNAALVGRFEAGLDQLTFPYAKPQESGHRASVRELELKHDGESWVRFSAQADAAGHLPGFTLAKNTAQEVTASAHPHELPAPSHSYLYLDAAQHGLGSRSCGPDVWPDFALRPEARTLVLKVSAL